MSTDEDLNAEAVRAEERKRIARDVHDELGGDLAAIKMALAVLGRRLPQDEGLREQLAYVDKLVDGAIDSMHRVADKWRHVTTESFQQFVERQVAAFSTQSGIRCRPVLAGAPLAMSTREAQALAHMLRECLTNIAKHAQATGVRIGFHASDHRLVLEIEDDGVGAAADQAYASNGMGVRGMRERTSELGGDFSMRDAAPHGTLVVIELPLGSESINAAATVPARQG